MKDGRDEPVTLMFPGEFLSLAADDTNEDEEDKDIEDKDMDMEADEGEDEEAKKEDKDKEEDKGKEEDKDKRKVKGKEEDEDKNKDDDQEEDEDKEDDDDGPSGDLYLWKTPGHAVSGLSVLVVGKYLRIECSWCAIGLSTSTNEWESCSMCQGPKIGDWRGNSIVVVAGDLFQYKTDADKHMDEESRDVRILSNQELLE